MFFFSSDLKKKFSYLFIVIGLTLMPIILHYRGFNLVQYNLFTLIYFLVIQFLFLFLILIISYLISFFLFKKKYFQEITISNFTIFFFQFFYFEVLSNGFIESLGNYYFLFDNFFVLILYLILYFTIFLLLLKFKRLTINFLIIFLLFNLSFGFYNINFPKKNITNIENYVSSNKIDLNKINKQNLNSTNIHIILLDGMIDLNDALNQKIISTETKNEFDNILINNNFKYNDLFYPNYAFTDHAIKTLFYGDYTHTDKFIDTNFSSSLFPKIMKKKDNFFYQLINKLNVNFFWIGNNFIPCIGQYSGECFYNYKNKDLFFTKIFLDTHKLYENSIFSYLFRFYIDENFISGYNFLDTKSERVLQKETSDKMNFFFIHAVKPHVPYTLDKNCNETIKLKPNNVNEIGDLFPLLDKSDHKKFYGYQYNCAFRAAINFTNDFIDKREENLIIILGDHAWNFDNKKKNINKFVDKLQKVFFAYKLPNRCQNNKVPNSHVNIMRFILQCVTDEKFIFLKDEQYITREFRDKLDPDYGSVIELSKALNSLK